MRITRNNRLVSNAGTTNDSNLHDTAYSGEIVGGVRLLKFAGMPEGCEARLDDSRPFALRNGGVRCAYAASTPVVNRSIRPRSTARTVLLTALCIRQQAVWLDPAAVVAAHPVHRPARLRGGVGGDVV